MLKIVTVPNIILNSSTKPVTVINDEIKKIVSDMEKVLVAQNDPPGVGLAANQVGLNLSIFILKTSEKSKTKVFINPVIVSRSDPFKVSPKRVRPYKNKGPKIKLEGCLSIPRIWGPVKRKSRVFLKYQDITGKEYLKWFTGFESIIIQHEMDHLSGIVFTQRSLEQKQPIYEEKDGELQKINVSLK